MTNKDAMGIYIFQLEANKYPWITKGTLNLRWASILGWPSLPILWGWIKAAVGQLWYFWYIKISRYFGTLALKVPQIISSCKCVQDCWHLGHHCSSLFLHRRFRWPDYFFNWPQNNLRFFDLIIFITNLFIMTKIGVQTIISTDLTLVLGVHDRTVYDNGDRCLFLYLYFFLYGRYILLSVPGELLEFQKSSCTPTTTLQTTPTTWRCLNWRRRWTLLILYFVSHDKSVFTDIEGEPCFIRASLSSSARSWFRRHNGLGLW